MMRGVSVWLALLALVPGTPLARADVVNSIQVRSNFYSPQEMRLAVGDTVTWTAFDDGHTVTAEDLRFDYYSTRTMRKGESVQFTFTTDETVYYKCRIHGPAMFGVLIVGTGGSPGGGGGQPGEVRSVPSAEFPTISAAIAGAPARATIQIAPGAYHESVLVNAPDITIRGTGTWPGAVQIVGGDQATGIRVMSDGVSIENLSVSGYPANGVLFDTVDRYAATDVIVTDNGSYGVRAVGSRFGLVRDVVARGAGIAGISIADCESCDVIVEDVLAEQNYIAMNATSASALIVRDSVFRDNASGIVVRSAGSTAAPQRGATIYGNAISDNASRTTPVTRQRSPDDIASGSAIWVAGGLQNTIEHNAISGQHEYGIVVTALVGASAETRIRLNDITGTRRADLGWDGNGVDVCFTGNRRPGAADVTTEPPHAQTIYSCDLPVTIGIPYPKVLIDIALYSTR